MKMRRSISISLVIAMITSMSLFLSLSVQVSASVGTQSYTFDDVAIGSLPVGWTVMSALTGTPVDPTPHVVYQVISDATVPGAVAGNKVLKLSSHSTPVYDDGNHCWTNNIQFTDGTISADIMASDTAKGHIGLSFRIKDHKNYYGVRFSFVQGDISAFKVKNGVGGGSQWYTRKC